MLREITSDSAMAAAFCPWATNNRISPSRLVRPNFSTAFAQRLGGGLVLEALGRQLLLETPHEFDPAIVPNPECAGNEQQKRENG